MKIKATYIYTLTVLYLTISSYADIKTFNSCLKELREEKKGFFVYTTSKEGRFYNEDLKYYKGTVNVCAVSTKDDIENVITGRLAKGIYLWRQLGNIVGGTLVYITEDGEVFDGLTFYNAFLITKLTTDKDELKIRLNRIMEYVKSKMYEKYGFDAYLSYMYNDKLGAEAYREVNKKVIINMYAEEKFEKVLMLSDNKLIKVSELKNSIVVTSRTENPALIALLDEIKYYLPDYEIHLELNKENCSNIIKSYKPENIHELIDPIKQSPTMYFGNKQGVIYEIIGFTPGYTMLSLMGEKNNIPSKAYFKYEEFPFSEHYE